MTTHRRWLKSVLVTSTETLPALPWQRGNRHRPAAVAKTPRPAPVPQLRAAS